MKNYFIETPLFQSAIAKKQLGLNVSYKMECYQPSGSFKIRGMTTILQEFVNQGHSKVIASSGGNAGYSLAFVGKQMNVSVRLVVPKSTSLYMIEKIKSLDADVEIYGETWSEANEYALQLVAEHNLPYIPPFDHPLLWQGHSTLIDECALQMEQPDKIIVAVGGGGLLCGIFEGLKRNNWTKTKVITAETEGAASFAKSYEANSLVELDAVNTIATSLAAKKVAAKTLEYASQFNVEPYVTTDKNAFIACQDFLNEYHTLVEPACGAALSYVKTNYSNLSAEEKILVIVCGGVNMGIDKFNEYTELYKKN